MLVEDYPTNQHVALKHLREAGYQVDLVEDGSKAVAIFQKNKYDLILMDVQMPVMDGYRATRRIRELEKERRKVDGSGNLERIPIIATTANALKGDREKCLASGMDDYISKPLRRKLPMTTVEKWLFQGDSGDLFSEDKGSVTGKSATSSSAPMDVERAIDEFEGDRAFLVEVLKGFVDNVTQQLAILNQAVRDNDAERVAKEAHAIKGGAANLTAKALADAAHMLEKTAKSGDLTNATIYLEKLEEELQDIRVFFPDKNNKRI